MRIITILSAIFLAFTGGGVIAQEPLTVMSYNVCWQCMSPGRAGLGGQCRDTTVNDGGAARSVTSCSQAMGRAIDGYAERYDFIGMQEASNWQDFRFLAPETIGRMQAITRPPSGHEEMVIFYDPERFTHRFRSINGDIGRGRPIMVNLFTDQEGGAYTFVNIHNCHGGCSLTRLEQAIDDALRVLDAPDYAEVSAFVSRSRIILTGDFNEASYRRTGTGPVTWRPFGDAGIGTEAGVRDAPTSCCSTVIPWNCSGLEPWCRPGDYVFDSAGAAVPRVPERYDVSVPQSDHKPVIAVLP
ncbi:endonuclease/exonuclease/phosphatase family protein [Primorskyibacter aestuariivivens]|uniref:endonuclease/exonuclease/phosphatase family protein n=1 Tax=Primorskyibacter aestuariivivens TaxID=1888912 RepID=UPI002300D435|nr:endonuclease/exonuclease/phosphatase family protein [Primorskyibacter aestuariivivens]MDA7428115.1 endonuclease/exonuclease/phosphatase family protein [Primorskyibacter aestuariivivens]